MPPQRVVCFVDGFNLYHSIVKLKNPYLKWLNLWSLASVFVPKQTHELCDVYYFSSYANWLPQSKRRHQAYVKALTAFNVKTIKGKFKDKDRKCPSCAHRWVAHEEKETDVNIALEMLNQAYQNKYNVALLISNDSDLAPAIKMIRTNFSSKLITTIAPPHSFHSNELIQASSHKSKITIDQLKRCLLPKETYDAKGNT